MKIGFIRRGHSSTGGAEAYLLRLAAGLNGLGVETSLITTSEWPEDRWPHGKILRLPGKSLQEFASTFSQTQTGCDLHFSLERVPGCDVFRAGDGVHAAWMDRRNGFEPIWKRLTRWMNRKHSQILRLERSVFDPSRTKAVIANSNMVRNEILSRFPFPADRVHVVYNGITPFGQLPDRAESRKKWQIADNTFCPLFLGTGWDRKGLSTAIRAVEMMEDTTLIVAGRGPADLFRSNKARFLGPVSDIAGLFSAADILVLPTWYDPFSNACLEALAAGLPVITSTANGFAEIITPSIHGEAIPPGDAHAVAEALERWRTPGRCANARNSCLELASNFSIERNARETLAILEKITTPSR